MATSHINYIYLIIQKAINIMISLDIEVFAMKIVTSLVFEIDKNSIYIGITLIE